MIKEKDLPDGWNIKKVNEFAEVITGGTPSTSKKEYWEGGAVPWLPSGDMKNKPIEEAHKFITEEGLKNSAAKIMPKKTVAIALTGATTGKIGLLELEACANQSVTGILPSNEHIPEYLFYYLQTIRKKVLFESYGGAQPHISQGYVKKIKVILPPLQTQKKIVAILEKAERLKEWRKEADELTDEFLKSTFLEMFGDPVTNPNEWNIKKLNDIILNIEAGWSVNGEQRRRKENEFAVLKISAVTSGFFIPDEHKVITNCENLKKIITPEKGDLLFSRANTRELVGATCIVRDNYPYLLLPDKLWKIKLDEQKISSEYLKFILSHPAIRREISKHATGSSGSMLNISMSKLKSISIIVPPIELQQKFASIVQQVEQLREHQSQSRQHIDDLFNVLMQKAFKGELI